MNPGQLARPCRRSPGRNSRVQSRACPTNTHRRAAHISYSRRRSRRIVLRRKGLFITSGGTRSTAFPPKSADSSAFIFGMSHRETLLSGSNSTMRSTSLFVVASPRAAEPNSPSRLTPYLRDPSQRPGVRTGTDGSVFRLPIRPWLRFEAHQVLWHFLPKHLAQALLRERPIHLRQVGTQRLVDHRLIARARLLRARAKFIEHRVIDEDRNARFAPLRDDRAAPALRKVVFGFNVREVGRRFGGVMPVSHRLYIQ